MADKTPYSRYVIVTDKPEKAEGLHNLVAKLKDEFFTNDAVQDLLLNYGAPLLDNERTKSYINHVSGVWWRNLVAVHLAYLELVIDWETSTSSSVNLSEPEKGIIIPGEQQKEAFEIPSDMLEFLQTGWFTYHDTREKIREYQKQLNTSFDEFNLQLIINYMANVFQTRVLPQYKEACKLKEEIDAFFEPKLLWGLSRAYHARGASLFHGAARLRQELEKSEYGVHFTVPAEKAHEQVCQLMSRLSRASDEDFKPCAWDG